MKKLCVIFFAVLLTASVFLPQQTGAQSPDKMSYQAVIRDGDGKLVSTQIGMQISILQGSDIGTPVYVETQTPTPNANGLVTIEIGGGTPVTGTFAAIDWSDGPYYIKTETATVAPLTTYTITGTSQFLSVPYALYAKRAGEHYAGELFGGGVVFWVDQTGSHGLICSMIDLSTAEAWSDVISSLIGATAQSDWDGQSNTNAIVAQSTATSAADLCDVYTNANYGTGTFSDWYLPSRSELNHLFKNIYQVQKALDSDGNSATTPLAKAYYWSSSEISSSTAWYFTFNFGLASSFNKVNAYYVRAVRAF